MVDVNNEAQDLIEKTILLIRSNKREIMRSMPCQLTIHLPPPGSRDEPCLELNRVKLGRNPSCEC